MLLGMELIHGFYIDLCVRRNIYLSTRKSIFISISGNGKIKFIEIKNNKQ